jgi:hypothetical protein
MSPTGSDTNSGLDINSPVKTLNRVESIVGGQTTDIQVRIAQGTYVDNQTTWTTYIPGRTITFAPADWDPGDNLADLAGRPVFESDGSQSSWFYAKLSNPALGMITGLRFFYLEVRGYTPSGITISGGYTTSGGYSVPAGPGANGNMIHGMKFQHLGSKWNSSAEGWGGIVLANSSNNTITENEFTDLENVPATAGNIHGVYIRVHSSANVIEYNDFHTVSGNPVHFRHDSNNNSVKYNTFIFAGVNGYHSEWFCDSLNLCWPTNPRECASHGNLFQHNDVTSGYSGQALNLWYLTPPSNQSQANLYEGGPSCDNESQLRVTTGGNY